MLIMKTLLVTSGIVVKFCVNLNVDGLNAPPGRLN